VRYLLEVGAIPLAGTSTSLRTTNSFARPIVGCSGMDIFCRGGDHGPASRGRPGCLLTLGLTLIFGVSTWSGAYADLSCAAVLGLLAVCRFGLAASSSGVMPHPSSRGRARLFVHLLIIAPILRSRADHQLLATGVLL